MASHPPAGGTSMTILFFLFSSSFLSFFCLSLSFFFSTAETRYVACALKIVHRDYSNPRTEIEGVNDNVEE